MNAFRWIAPALLLALAFNSFADEKSDELKVLDRYIGTWDGQVNEMVPEEKTATETGTAAWEIGDKYVQIKSSTKLDDSQAMHLITYDAQKQNYHYYWFSSTGMTFNATGNWDATAKTFTWDGQLADSLNIKMTDHFIDDNTRELHVTVKDSNGDTVFEMKAKSTRRKA